MPADQGNTKFIVLIGDGMGDYPLPELDGRTPLEAALTPHMDEVDAQVVDLGAKVRQGIQHALLGAPVKSRVPILHQLLDVGQR